MDNQWLLLHPDGPALNMAHVTKVESVAGADGRVEVHFVDRHTEFYHGDEARRIHLWLAKRGELPVLAAGSSLTT